MAHALESESFGVFENLTTKLETIFKESEPIQEFEEDLMTFSHSFSSFLDYLISFLEEQQTVCSHGDLKSINEGLSSALFAFKSLISSLFTVLKSSPSAPTLRSLHSFITQSKEHLYAVIKSFKRKLTVYSDLSCTEQIYRMKSSNLRHHADELLASLHALALCLDDLESALSTTCTLLVYNERDHSGLITTEVLNVQVGASDRTNLARQRSCGFAMEVE